ncbi:MAG: hypothetical protein SCI24_03405 [Halomonas sp.]|nr:hypothetical protein [Halomonas sp.]MDW7745652.1 hypothetical protein [Halomonas sp.]
MAASTQLMPDTVCVAIDGDVQVAFLLLVGHLRQVLDVDMHEAWLVVLEGLVPRLPIIASVLPSQFRQRRHLAPLEHAMQPGAWQARVQELTRHEEEIIQAEAKEFASRDQHILLLGREPASFIRVPKEGAEPRGCQYRPASMSSGD